MGAKPGGGGRADAEMISKPGGGGTMLPQFGEALIVIILEVVSNEAFSSLIIQKCEPDVDETRRALMLHDQ